MRPSLLVRSVILFSFAALCSLCVGVVAGATLGFGFFLGWAAGFGNGVLAALGD